MSHQTAGASYLKLSERINRFPHEAPLTELLLRISRGTALTPAEAELVVLLPIQAI
jgi:hypothetical protein